MQANLLFSVINEAHQGPIGDDWRYWVEAKVYNEGLKGEVTIKVDEHSVADGVSQQPPGPPEPALIPAGDHANPVLVKIRAEATEVDTFKNDVGSKSVELTLECPSPGNDPLVIEQDIQIGVVETPAITGVSSVFTITIRIVLACE